MNVLLSLAERFTRATVALNTIFTIMTMIILLLHKASLRRRGKAGLRECLFWNQEIPMKVEVMEVLGQGVTLLEVPVDLSPPTPRAETL